MSYESQLDAVNHEMTAEEKPDAAYKLAVKRSEALFNFYASERRAGASPIEANERMAAFAKRLDARSPFEVELEAVREIMESAK